MRSFTVIGMLPNTICRAVPMRMNTIENPPTKRRVLRRMCRREGGVSLSTESPAMFARYTGTSGTTHGDANEAIPRPNARGRETAIIDGTCRSEVCS